MSRLFDLSGRTALVTGGGRGIGLAMARAFAAHGARVVIAGRNEETLAGALPTLASHARGHVAHPVDVADADSVRALHDRLDAEDVRVDVLVNNAGIDPHYAALEKTDPQDWDRILRTNLAGVMHCCRTFGAAMIGGGGSIINISSIAGHVGLKRQVPYCASKGGVEQLTRSLALDWAEHGIRVNAIAFGFVETDLTRSILAHPQLGEMLRARTPLGRAARADEVAGAAVFLASEASSYVTGHSLCVDGGWTAS
jgi:gluconate 5-dehydrogenase